MITRLRENQRRHVWFCCFPSTRLVVPSVARHPPPSSVLHPPSSIRRGDVWGPRAHPSPSLYCLSCWVSVSHVRALAVKTSVDEVSADTVPLLNQWPLKVWEQASLSHWVWTRSELRVTDVLSSAADAVLHPRSHRPPSWVWRRGLFPSTHLPPQKQPRSRSRERSR